MYKPSIVSENKRFSSELMIITFDCRYEYKFNLKTFVKNNYMTGAKFSY